jgi:hypothetical protein
MINSAITMYFLLLRRWRRRAEPALWVAPDLLNCSPPLPIVMGHL